jgi:peptidyl-prolyl cis-trans isomerase A (cyclophilin A)
MSDSLIRRRSLLGAAGLLIAAPDVSWAAGKPRVVMTTALGAITLQLEHQKAPLTTANFLRYVAAGKYDGATFFRAARTKGAPKTGTIVGAPPPRQEPFPPIGHEPTSKTGLKHLDGTISIGRFSPGTARGNFFICVGPQPYLDAKPGAPGDNLGFAAFGQVVSGMSVVRRILAAPTNPKIGHADQKGQWLDPPVTITTARRA